MGFQMARLAALAAAAFGLALAGIDAGQVTAKRDHSSGALVARAFSLAGQPFPGIRVTAMPQRGGTAREAVTGRDGTCRLDLPPGIYRVDFALAGYDIERRNHVRVEDGEPASVEARLKLSGICECLYYEGPQPLAERGGQVLDARGRPLPHARVEFATPERKESRYTDGRGRFRVRVPVRGSWPLTASDSGFRAVTLQVSGAAGPIVLRLPPAGTRDLPAEQRLDRGCRCPDDLFVHPERLD
jgi:hypothetical protein